VHNGKPARGQARKTDNVLISVQVILVTTVLSESPLTRSAIIAKESLELSTIQSSVRSVFISPTSVFLFRPPAPELSTFQLNIYA
jgi:hypothetical protein